MAAEQEIWLDTWVKGEPLPDGLQRAGTPREDPDRPGGAISGWPRPRTTPIPVIMTVS